MSNDRDGGGKRPFDHDAKSSAPEETKPEGDDLGFALPPPARLTFARAVALGLLAAAGLGAVFVVGYLPKRRARAELESGAAAIESKLKVELVTPKVGASDRALLMPGSVQPLAEAVLFSRANGFVKRWLVDMGDKVDEGQLLVEIETPEVDQELAQARAQLAQAQAQIAQSKASRDYSRSQVDRFKQLVPSGVAAQQDLDQKQSQASVDEANVNVASAAANAAQANIQRLQQLKGFAHVVAPFQGTITQRTVEKGALVSAGSSPLYKVSAMDPARVFLQIPQDIAPSVHAGVAAKVSIREFSGRTFDGTVARTAGALDAATRTMNVEVRVPNPKGELLAGMYAEVAMTLPTPHRVLELPPTSIFNDAKGVRVAVVGPDERIHLVNVVIERDTGPSVLIASGLSETDRVVKLARSDLVEGLEVTH